MFKRMAVLLAVAGTQGPVAAQEALPTEIRAYYDDHNFVVENSTVEQRQRLVSSRADEKLDPKLREVQKRMARVAERVIAIDPGIAMLERSDPSYILRDTNILEPRGHALDMERGIAVVDLDVIAFGTVGIYYVAPKSNAQAAPRPIPLRVGQATHRWVRLDGTWRREAATRILTDFQAGTPLTAR